MKPFQGLMKIAKRRWLLIAFIVTLLHLLILTGAAQLALGLLSTEDPPENLISVQMVAPPAAKPRIKPPPAPPKPALPSPGQELPLAQAPLAQEEIKDPPDQADFEDPDAAQPIASVPFETLTPEIEDLPRAGAIAIDAFWGDYQTGSKVAQGFIELAFPNDTQYDIKLTTKAVGWASMLVSQPLQAQASGTLGIGGFQPLRYSHVSPRGRTELAEFDYEANKIVYSSLKEPLQMLKGTQDRLSFMIQLAWMLKVEPERFTLGSNVTVPIAGRKAVEEINFMVLSDQPIVLPGGILVPAVHLSSFQARDRFSGRIDVWLDRADRLLPVRIRFEEKRGQVVDLLAIRQP
jgi:hypothetical protein